MNRNPSWPWACALASSSLLQAQPAAQPGPDLDAAPRRELRADVDSGDVYLDDSFEASDAITRARELLSKGRSLEAAELLLQASDASGDKIIRVDRGRYTNVRAFVHRMVATLPSEARKVFRARCESELEGERLRSGNPPGCLCADH